MDVVIIFHFRSRASHPRAVKVSSAVAAYDIEESYLVISPSTLRFPQSTRFSLFHGRSAVMYCYTQEEHMWMSYPCVMRHSESSSWIETNSQDQGFRCTSSANDQRFTILEEVYQTEEISNAVIYVYLIIIHAFCLRFP